MNWLLKIRQNNCFFLLVHQTYGHCNSRMSTDNLFDYTLKNYLRAPVFPGMEGGDETVGDGKPKGRTKKSDDGK
jgi:hypothetical protein